MARFSSPLLTTKLRIPPQRTALVPRPRLIEQLDQGLRSGYKLTLVCGPAGFGKTTLVTEWLGRLNRPVAWLSLDEHDDDPARFLAYLVAALRQLDAGIGETAEALLKSPQPLPPERVLTPLINEIASIATPFVLTLDDYHAIQTPAIHQQHAFLLEHQPPQMHQVILTREDPPLPVSRLRARGQVGELRQEDLRFTLNETAEFLTRVMRLDVSADEIAILERRTEGWPAGLQLAALSMRGQADARGFVQAFAGSDRYVLDYLFEEVLQRQSDAVQAFLLQTSILGRMSAPLCDAVTGRGDSQTMIETLEQSNLFVVPLDASRTWYRYHRLFAELLRHRLNTREEHAAARLHLNASRWHEAEGNLADAADHALAACDGERAGRLISRISRATLGRGEIDTLLRWCQALPDAVLRAHLGLCRDYGWALILAGQHESAEPFLDRLEQAAQDDMALAGETLSAQAQIARARGDYPRTIHLAQRALALLPAADADARSLAAVTLGLAHSDHGHLAQAEQAFTEADRAARQAGDNLGRLTALTFLSNIQATRGKLRRAAELARQALQHGQGSPAVATVHSLLSALLYEWNELQAATAHAQQAMTLSQRGGHLEVQLSVYRVLARIRQAQGDASSALVAIEEAHRLADRKDVPPLARANNAAVHVMIALAQGDIAAATEWTEQVAKQVGASDLSKLLLSLTRAPLLLARKEKAAAAEMLETLHELAMRADWQSAAIEIRLLQALAAPAASDALTYLTDALTLAQPEGYCRRFLDKGEPMAGVLRAAAARGIAPDYIAGLLSAFHAEAQARASFAERTGVSTAPLAESLSERELEVLQLVATGLSNREIADRLIIGVGTVKSHVHNILGKLDARDRTQAAAKARQLNLL